MVMWTAGDCCGSVVVVLYCILHDVSMHDQAGRK